MTSDSPRPIRLLDESFRTGTVLAMGRLSVKTEPPLVCEAICCGELTRLSSSTT